MYFALNYLAVAWMYTSPSKLCMYVSERICCLFSNWKAPTCTSRLTLNAKFQNFSASLMKLALCVLVMILFSIFITLWYSFHGCLYLTRKCYPREQGLSLQYFVCSAIPGPWLMLTHYLFIEEMKMRPNMKIKYRVINIIMLILRYVFSYFL